MRGKKLTGIVTMLILLAAPSLWADESKKGPGEHGKGYGKHGDGMKGRHGGPGHFLRHLLMHQKEIGLSDDQVNKIKAIQMEMDKTRIRAEAEMEVSQRELHEMVRDDKADLAAIEAKLKQGANLEVGLHLAAIKAKREAMALLTPEQRAKEQAEHEKMMKMRGERHKEGMGHREQGMMPGGGHDSPPMGGPMHPSN